MPNEVKDLGDGKLEVKLETGEVFTGDALEITNKMADAHVSTKRWGQGMKTQAENLQAQVNQLSAPPPPPVTPAAQEEANLQKYLLDQTAKASGFSNAEEYLGTMKRVVGATENYESQRIAGEFMTRRPDFPNTPEAQEALAQYVQGNGWDFSVPSMLAAHDTLVREGKYKALTAEEQNAAWSGGLQASNRPKVPPMVSGGSDI